MHPAWNRGDALGAGGVLGRGRVGGVPGEERLALRLEPGEVHEVGVDGGHVEQGAGHVALGGLAGLPRPAAVALAPPVEVGGRGGLDVEVAVPRRGAWVSA